MNAKHLPRIWDSYQKEKYVQPVNISEELMPTYITPVTGYITIEAIEKGKRLVGFVELNLLMGSMTRKSSIGKLIVQEIQVDPCGNGWENLTLWQKSHIYNFLKRFSGINFSKHKKQSWWVKFKDSSFT